MSWSGYIPGSLVRSIWGNKIMSHMNAPTGMNTSSGSQVQYPPEPNAAGGKLEQSLSEIEGSLLAVTTVLRQAIQDVSTELAPVGIQPSNPDRPMTRGLGPVSPFTVKLMHYSGLILSHAEELLSIAQTPPAMDVSGSSEELESPKSSRLEGEPFSRSSDFEELYVGRDSAEPPHYSVVLDSSNDAWQRRHDGWECAISGGDTYTGWSWKKLTDEYTLRLIYRGRSD